MFAVRSFCWLLWIDGNNLKIQSPNNLGDLSLHITYIKYFANGVALWPDNPIHVFSSLRYPAGIDFSIRFCFSNTLTCPGPRLDRIAWLVATFYGFYRWGGAFGVAGFLFNGGLAGYRVLSKVSLHRLPGGKIAWKSIPLTMFVTQRGLLYAIPAGLLLLLHWRRKYFPGESERNGRRAARARPVVGRVVALRDDAALPRPHLPRSLDRARFLVAHRPTGRCENRSPSCSPRRLFRRPGSSG